MNASRWSPASPNRGPWRYQAALKAAFAEMTNDDIAATYGVSNQFAQMRMVGARKHAAYALAKQARTGQPW